MRFYSQVFRYTNLDIALGACINCFFFSKVYGVSPGITIYLLLFSAVWVIYTLDRLLDTRKSLNMLLPRHEFHITHRRILLIFCLLLAVLSLLLLRIVDNQIVFPGLMLSGVIAIYLLVAMLKIRVAKELIIAVIYTFGVSMAPIVLSDTLEIKWMLLFQHSMLAFMNLSIISWFEKAVDSTNGHFNIANFLGRRLNVLMNSLFFIFLACGYFSGIEYGWEFQFPLLLMWGVLILLWNRRDYFARDDLYGILADGAFFLPITIMLF